jgi:uncharacterized membrane protein
MVRLVRSPCTWLVLAAILGYGAFATYQYERLGTNISAVDLGIFYQAVQGWAFHGDPYVAIKGFSQLGDHFTPAWMLLAPLLWIHNSAYMLVLAQVVLLSVSAVPVYLAAQRMLNTWLATALTAAYLASSGLQHAVAFPVHEVMFAVPLIAWALERMLVGRWTWASLLMASLSLVKEDLNLTILAFAAVALTRRRWWHAAALAVWAVAAYLLTIKVLIPAFSPQGYTYLNAYSTTLHASNSFQAFWNLITQPRHTAHLLFGSSVKRHLWEHLLEPVGFLALASPIGWLILPNLVSRLASGNPGEWSWNFHYDAPLMPIIVLGAVDGVRRCVALASWLSTRREGAPAPGRPLRERRGLMLGASALALVATTTTTYLSYKSLPLGRWIRRPSSYASSATWLADERSAVAAVPPGVTVQVTNHVAVPLLNRDTVTLVSDLPSGNWAVLDTVGTSATDPTSYAAHLRSEGYVTVRTAGTIMVLHKTGK